MFLFLFLLEIHRDKNSLLLSRRLCCCSVWLVRIKGILAEVITAPVREGTAFPVGYANTSPDWSVWYCWSLSVIDMPVASQETWESFLCLFSAWMQRWVQRLLGIVKLCRTCDALTSQEGTRGVLRALPGTQDVQVCVCMRKALRSWRAERWGILQSHWQGNILQGWTKSLSFHSTLILPRKLLSLTKACQQDRGRWPNLPIQWNHPSPQWTQRSLSFSPSRALLGRVAPCVGIQTCSGSGSRVSHELCLC